jgi:type VI protein secretion system component VasK
MAEIRETHVERDEEGRVIDTKVVVERPKKKGGFGWGMLFGALLIAAAVIGYGYSQGSFQQAGVEADQVAAQVEQSTESAVDTTSDAINNATENTDQAQNETSETATN